MNDLKKHFLSTCSHGINAYLGLDPESKHRLQHLAGKAITIELLPFHFIFQCIFTTDGVELKPDTSHPAETTLRGTPLQLAGAMLLKNQRHRFFADDLVMEGNAEIGLEVIDLFDAIHIDWEEYASLCIGDAPAYHVSHFVKRFKNFLQSANTSLFNNVTEYAQEEALWLPSEEALADFFNDIDTLRMDVDRAEARVRQLIDATQPEGIL
jgi:ubiquinone biosynthesis accessory factor UbiJ